MKKTHTISIKICIIFIIGLIFTSCQKTVYPVNGMTLNGVPVGDAIKMIKSFRNNSSCTDSRISFWASRSWLEKIDTILHDEGADGLRFYYAKDTQSNKNKLIIVSTYLASCLPIPTPFKDSIHQDYFNHNESFFRNNLNNLKLKEEYKLSEDESMLYYPKTPCPDLNCSITEPNHQINCSEARKYVDYFYNNGNPKDINTYSEWISLSDLEMYLNEFKEEDREDSTKKADGIRIYYGKTPDKPITNNDRNKNALIFVTTTHFIKKSNSDTIHLDFFDCDKQNSKLKNTSKLRPMQTTSTAIAAGEKYNKCPGGIGCAGSSH